MKKILLLTSVALAVLSGCGSLDINEDPNHPGDSNVSADIVMPSAQTYIAGTYGDLFYNLGGFFVQYFDQNPTANQYNNLTWYNITPDENLTDRIYANYYSGGLMDIKKVQEKTKNTADIYAAEVMRVFAFQTLVDLTGETPYSEALQGSAKQMPKYDDGKDIYLGLLRELDSVEAKINPEEAMECKDLITGTSAGSWKGDVAKWKGFANALRLRMYLRLIQGGVDAASYTEKAKTLVQSGAFFSGNIEYNPEFKDEKDKSNPWYETNKRQLAPNHVAAMPIISYMTGTNDPRISYSFEMATKGDNAGKYAGLLPGTHAEKGFTYDNIGYFSALKYYVTKPVELFTQAELQFLKAEVYAKYLSDDASAKAAYEAGVKADFSTRGYKEADADAFLAQSATSWDAQGSTDAKLHLLYMQKWVALLYMDPFEAWSEQRRTNVPEWNKTDARGIAADATTYTAGNLIYPYRNDLGKDVAPVRLFYCTASINVNKNAPKQPALTVPVFWDK